MREDGQRTCFTLGKMVTQGGVLLHDDLEGLLKFGEYPGYRVATLVKEGASAYAGSFGLHLTGRGIFPDLLTWYYTARSFGRTAHQTLEVSGLFRLQFPLKGYGYELRLDFQRKGDNPICAIRWREDIKKFQYLWSGGGWRYVPGVTEELDNSAWHRLYFMVDLARDIYVGAGVDSIKFEMGGLGIPIWPIVAPERNYVVVGTSAKGRGVRGMGVDEVLVREV